MYCSQGALSHSSRLFLVYSLVYQGVVDRNQKVRKHMLSLFCCFAHYTENKVKLTVNKTDF